MLFMRKYVILLLIIFVSGCSTEYIDWRLRGGSNRSYREIGSIEKEIKYERNENVILSKRKIILEQLITEEAEEIERIHASILQEKNIYENTVKLERKLGSLIINMEELKKYVTGIRLARSTMLIARTKNVKRKLLIARKAGKKFIIKRTLSIIPILRIPILMYDIYDLWPGRSIKKRR